MSLEILIRVDSSDQIGSGHLVRCLNLAKKLRSRGCNVLFITRHNKSNFNFLFYENSFEVIVMPETKSRQNSDQKQEGEYSHWLGVSQMQDAEETITSIGNRRFDWIIVDHYALDHRWQDQLRPKTRKIMVIDDLANRTHRCDLLLDQNFYLNKDERYLGLVNSNCKCLLGPANLLSSDQFDNFKSANKLRQGLVTRVLVFFGSVDDAKQTELAIEAIISLKEPNIIFDVVVGKNNLRAVAIEQLCNSVENLKFHCQVDNMSDFIFNADFALGAGGATTWERAKLGLPAAVTIVAKNQVESTMHAEKAGILINLGNISNVSSKTYLETLQDMIKSPDRLREMSYACLDLFNNSQAPDTVDIICHYRKKQ